MKFHPGMKDRDKISSWDEKKKKKRVNTSSRDEILKWACFFWLLTYVFKYVLQIQYIWT